MNKEKGDCIGGLGAGMPEVNLNGFKFADVMGGFIDFVLYKVPVEIISPFLIKIVRPVVFRFCSR